MDLIKNNNKNINNPHHISLLFNDFTIGNSRFTIGFSFRIFYFKINFVLSIFTVTIAILNFFHTFA